MEKEKQIEREELVNKIKERLTETLFTIREMYHYLKNKGYKFSGLGDKEFPKKAVEEGFAFDISTKKWFKKSIIEEDIHFDNKKEESIIDSKEEPKVKELPKIKRFATYEESFAYFLVMIQYKLLFIKDGISLHKMLPGRRQRIILHDIVEETLKRQNWYWDSSDESTGEVEQHKVIRASFTKDEIRDNTNWELIDYNIRLVLNKTSFQSRNKRDFLMELFLWVDNFVAKEGEEVTMTLEDLVSVTPESIMELAKSNIEIENKEKILKHKEDVENS